MLLWASVLTGDVNTYDRFPCPAACLYTSDDGKGGDPGKWMIICCFYVVYNYPAALSMLWRRFRRWWMDLVNLRIHPGNGPPRGIGWVGIKLQKRWRLAESMLKNTAAGRVAWMRTAWTVISLCASLVKKALYYGVWTMMASEALSFIEVVIWLGLGIKWAMEDRDVGHTFMRREQRKIEDSWGFGQLLPLIFLFLPFIQFAESYASHCYEEARGQELTNMQTGIKGP